MGTLAASSASSLNDAFALWNALLETLPVGVYVCDREGRVTHHNRRASELWGRTPGPEELFCGSYRLRRRSGEVLPHADCPMGAVLASGEPARDEEVVVERPDGSQVEVLVNIAPLRDTAGAMIGAVNCFQDVTEVKRAQARADRFGGWVRRVVDRSPVAIYWTDAEGRVMAFNAAAAGLWGREPRIGEDLWCGSYQLFHPDGRPMPLDTCPMAMALKSGEAVQGLEAIYERPDGRRGAFLAYPTLLHDEGGQLSGAVNMLVDISDRKEAELRQKVLIDELNHRVKNTLASVQSLAAHSLRGEADPDHMREVFESRLVALANAHNQLADRSWQDADLYVLAHDVLAPWGGGGRLAISGDRIMIPARATVSLSLVLHELATNAVKYGALSTAAGRVALSWRREDGGELTLDWMESGGPPVTKPQRRGFGTRFIAGAVAGDLGGRLAHEFDSRGVRCRIEAPI